MGMILKLFVMKELFVLENFETKVYAPRKFEIKVHCVE